MGLSDWTALVSVISSAVVAVVTLVVNALMRRGDRKHAVSLEFDKRVWDAKSTALLALIEKCDVIRMTIRESERHGAAYRQGALYWVFHENFFLPGGPALTAYAAPSVNHLVDQLNQIMRQTISTDALLYVGRIPEFRKQIEEAIDRGDFEGAARTRDEEVETMDAMGKASGIDVPAVDKLCGDLIAAARRDLRSEPHPLPGGKLLDRLS
jgi:hypothetical protein